MTQNCPVSPKIVALDGDTSFKNKPHAARFLPSMKYHLPLPEGFECRISDEFGGEDIDHGTAQDFLDILEYGCDQYSDIARFVDGKLMEVRISR